MRQTSIDAYRSIIDFLGVKQREVYEALSMAPMSNAELADFLHKPINCITPRVNELVHYRDHQGHEMPLVKYGGIKIHPITRRKQIVWKIINQLEVRQYKFFSL